MVTNLHDNFNHGFPRPAGVIILIAASKKIRKLYITNKDYYIVLNSYFYLSIYTASHPLGH